MEAKIKEIEAYAKINDVPIMEYEGILFLQDIIKQHHVTSILEIGSAIGYSAIQMCQIDSAIKVVTIERDEERYNEAVRNIKNCQLEDQITIVLGDALTCKIEGSFDLIFIDAAKAQYINFFERYEPLLKLNGLILSDNLSFHGLVENKDRIKNRNTRQLVKKIERYINYLQEHKQYDTTFYPLGDGVAISKRKED